MPGPHLLSNDSTTPGEEPRTPSRGVKRKFSSLIAQKQGLGLRHMVHTRLVVREICLPFTAFTSSQQLVRIIYGCINGMRLHRQFTWVYVLTRSHSARTGMEQMRVHAPRCQCGKYSDLSACLSRGERQISSLLARASSGLGAREAFRRQDSSAASTNGMSCFEARRVSYL